MNALKKCRIKSLIESHCESFQKETFCISKNRIVSLWIVNRIDSLSTQRFTALLFHRGKKFIECRTTLVWVNDDRPFVFGVNHPSLFLIQSLGWSSCPGLVCDRSLFFFAGIYVLLVPKCLNVFLNLLSNVYLGLRTLCKNDKKRTIGGVGGWNMHPTQFYDACDGLGFVYWH